MNKFINSSKFGDELLFISNLAVRRAAQLAVQLAAQVALQEAVAAGLSVGDDVQTAFSDR